MNFLHNRLIITLQKLGHVLLNIQKVNFPLHVHVKDVVYFGRKFLGGLGFWMLWFFNVDKNQSK